MTDDEEAFSNIVRNLSDWKNVTVHKCADPDEHTQNYRSYATVAHKSEVPASSFAALRYASAVLAVVVCRSVCPSVTRRYCVKTAERRIMETMPHDSPGTLVFRCQRTWQNWNGVTLNGGTKCRCAGLKKTTFDK